MTTTTTTTRDHSQCVVYANGTTTCRVRQAIPLADLRTVTCGRSDHSDFSCDHCSARRAEYRTSVAGIYTPRCHGRPC